MTEHGVVVEIAGARTVVELKQTDQCGRCRACMRMGEDRMRLEVDTVPGISVGDSVEVDIPVSRLRAVLTVFVLPLAAVLLGAVLGNYLTETYFPQTEHPNLLSLLLALAFVVLAFLGVYLYERTRGSGKGRPTIRRPD